MHGLQQVSLVAVHFLVKRELKRQIAVVLNTFNESKCTVHNAHDDVHHEYIHVSDNKQLPLKAAVSIVYIWAIPTDNGGRCRVRLTRQW